MSQPSVSSFFINRKRGLDEDSVISKKKVICLERSSSESSNGANYEEKEASTKIVYPSSKLPDIQECETNQSFKKTIRTTVAPQRVTRSRKNSDTVEPPKLVNFFKAGNLSPKKKPRLLQSIDEIPIQNTIERESKTEITTQHHGMITPTKQMAPTTNLNHKVKSFSSVEITSMISTNSLNSEEIKKKLKNSSRLTELKTSLNKLKSGLDRMDQLEKKKSVSNALKAKYEVAATTTASSVEPIKTLKPFTSIELEILSPTKQHSSPMKLQASPMKHTLLAKPKILTPKRLFSPMKTTLSPMKSPTKVPAYQRFQSLSQSGTSTLQLPYKYRLLQEMFKAVDTVCAMFFNRKEKITFKKLKPAVQRIMRKNFHETHLAQIHQLFPDAYKYAQEKTRNFGSTSKQDYYQLVIVPNMDLKDIDSDKKVLSKDEISLKYYTMNPQVLIERTRKFTEILIDLVFDEHSKFLQSLEKPMTVSKKALKRWHPDFDLERVPDVICGDLPLPPNTEKFSSAKDILSTARNLFSCATPMERALERLEAKKLEEKGKQNQNREQQEQKNSAIPDVGAANVNDVKKDIPNVPQKSTITDCNSLLKGVPKSLLDKIRAKQAARALETMTRRPSQEREAVKYARLPEIARHARSVFVTEKKSVLLLENVLKKIENSYKGTASLKEIEESLRMIAEEMSTWMSFHEIRNSMYVKLARDIDLANVLVRLEEISAQKAKM
ncbi:unnamed protein product [Diamesa hyperborea]